MREVNAILLDEITKRVVETVHPEKIILFGSHAWGQPTADSDLDLFVIVPPSDLPAYRRVREVYKALRGLKVPVDIVMQTSTDVEQKKNVITSLVKKVLEEGEVLYG
ncbi:MAG: nucleotidyltransferase domain-containing protein [Desulfuromusa sp.]